MVDIAQLDFRGLSRYFFQVKLILNLQALSGNTYGASITVRLTSYLTGLEMCVCAVQNLVHPAKRHISKPVKQEVNRTVILPRKYSLVKR